MVIAEVFRCEPINSRNAINIIETGNHPLQSAPISIPCPPSQKVKKLSTTSSSFFTILSSSPVVEGLEMCKTPDDKWIHATKTRKIKAQQTRCKSQGPWSSQPMPTISADMKKADHEPQVTRNDFLKRCFLRLRRACQDMPEPLQLDGPYINPVAGCSCGKCEQEFYINKYVGYGINIYGTRCTVVPAYCNDFAVVFYC